MNYRVVYSGSLSSFKLITMITIYPTEPITDYNTWIKYIYDQVKTTNS